MSADIPRPDEGMKLWYEVQGRFFNLYERERGKAYLGGKRLPITGHLSILEQVKLRTAFPSPSALINALKLALNQLDDFEDSKSDAKFLAQDLHSPAILYGSYNPKRKMYTEKVTHVIPLLSQKLL